MQDKPQITFPCDYPVKIIVKATEGVDARIVTIINKHQKKPFDGVLNFKPSKSNNYQSYSIVFHAESAEHLQEFFMDLKKDSDIMMLL